MSLTKRIQISIEEKSRIISKLEKGIRNTDLAKEYGVSHTTISTIWKEREKIQILYDKNYLKMKRARTTRHTKIEEALLKWFKYQRANNVPINGPILQQKANDFAQRFGEDFVCSSSWIQRFRARHGIVGGKMSGEAASADKEPLQIKDHRSSTESINDQNIEDTDVQLDETNPLDENPEEEIPRKRKRQSYDTTQDDYSQISHENPKNSHEYPQNSHENPHFSHETSHIEEECELVTKLWAKKLTRLPEDRRDDLIYKINSLLYKACIEYHKERTANVSAVKSRENISDYSESKSDDESIDFISIKTEPDDS